MTQQTSIDAYVEMTRTGVLGGLRKLVYKFTLDQNKPLTTRQITDALTKATEKKEDCIRPRLAELEIMGLLEHVGEAKCEMTHQRVKLWRSTGRICKHKLKDRTTSSVLKFKLAELGFETIYDYKKSAIWRSFNIRYAESHPDRRCCITGIRENLTLQHVRYNNIGSEKFEDVVVVCKKMQMKLESVVTDFNVSPNKAPSLIKMILE